mgnify:CR=1 FL=1
MSQMADGPVPPRATTKRSRRLPIIWIIPIAAIAIGAWLAYDTYSKRGPTITITFDTAEGLQPGQSQLKFKDIVFGTVQGVALTPDNRRVVVTVATNREAAPLLTGHGGKEPIHLDDLRELIARVSVLADNHSALSTVSLQPVNCWGAGVDVLGAEIFVAPAMTRKDASRRAMT